MYTNKKNTKYVSSSRVIHISYILPKNVLKTVYFLLLKELLTNFLFLYFIIFAPELEGAFGKANCRFLICLALYG